MDTPETTQPMPHKPIYVLTRKGADDQEYFFMPGAMGGFFTREIGRAKVYRSRAVAERVVREHGGWTVTTLK